MELYLGNTFWLLVLMIVRPRVVDCTDDSIPTEGCAAVTCLENSYCDLGKCFPLPTCKNYKCPAGEECHLEPVICKRAPCPDQPRCHPVDKCANVKCCQGFYCIAGQCIEVPKCNLFCPQGQICALEREGCSTPPCPLKPYCKVDKCAVVRCRGGYRCVDGRCEPTSCEYLKCPEGEECFMQQEDCPIAPCRTKPSCRPELTCATILCASGYICENRKCIPI